MFFYLSFYSNSFLHLILLDNNLNLLHQLSSVVLKLQTIVTNVLKLQSIQSE